MKTGLFFGSFNPIHIGHVAIAGYIVEFTDLEELWLVVSPHNPLKPQAQLADIRHRMEMVKLAVANLSPSMGVCDVEMQLPQPSYTIDTLKVLGEKYPQRQFTVIMGADSIDSIGKWKDSASLLNDYRIMVYPRLGSDMERIKREYHVETLAAPIIELSSTFIRQCLRDGKIVQYFMPSEAYRYMLTNRVYSNL